MAQVEDIARTAAKPFEGADAASLPLRGLPILAGVMLIALVGVGRRRSRAIR